MEMECERNVRYHEVELYVSVRICRPVARMSSLWLWRLGDRGSISVRSNVFFFVFWAPLFPFIIALFYNRVTLETMRFIPHYARLTLISLQYTVLSFQNRR